MKKILVAADVDRSLDERARGDARFEVVRRPVRTEAELAEIVGDAEVLVTRAYNRVTRRVFEAAPKLELIAQGTSGIDNIDLDAARERGIHVVHMPGVNANAVAELVIGFMIAMTRTVPFYTREIVRGVFSRDDCAARHELRHFRVGIVGLGNVGSLVAKYAGSFGMQVDAYDPYVAEARLATLDELLSASDILTLHVPLTDETRKMIGAREIALLPRRSYLINASRGEVLDQNAALEALRNDHLAGVALDVFDPEPPVEPLPDDPRLILTPHVAGCSHEVKTTVGGRLFEKIVEYYSLSS
ncbi:MAG TPA: NAD(P)-dependent oxidoreductase [Thermoanaerobaculia bacterium]|jgi:D-3-phosphoglycerate dehydrogenase|nr:NAD(P)-dependent oxidoreductase [Thermoanaerobaculia bacterium]